MHAHSTYMFSEPDLILLGIPVVTICEDWRQLTDGHDSEFLIQNVNSDLAFWADYVRYCPTTKVPQIL